LDTQWNWDYTKTIDVFLKRTLERNFDLFEKYPDYIFTFTGARRYRMMKEYYPDLYAKMLGYVRQGRWIAGGSCVEESEVNVSSSESMIREVLYGNAYYEREFGYRSIDYMLPDCFGFVASMPSVLAHAGIEGFSTQKLTWRSAAGIPFNVGFWQGPDGKGVVAALNATKYAGRIPERLDRDSAWIARIDANIARHGLHFDYRYYGVGDRGGSPRPDDVKNAVGSISNPDSEIDVRLTSSQQMFEDLTPALKRKLPVYAGDLLRVEHSAGSTTSQVFMKRMNRKNELLAKAAEQVAAGADAAGIARYPFEKINPAWELILGSQMHDILPGTAIPQAYEYSWNDEFVAANLLASTLENAVSRMAARMDTRTAGHPLVVYNPVAAERDDIAEATLALPADTRSVIVRDADGNILPSQIVSHEGNRIGFVFGCRMKPMSMEVFDVEPSAEPEQAPAELKVDGRTLENACYRVVIARNGDIESIFDKRLGRQLLTAPARLEFLHESPRQWPAWNMDWKDRRQAPVAFMDENAAVRVIERGPVRATLEVSRQGRDSRIVQRISLAAGEAGRRIEVDNRIDWQSTGVSLKAAFPLAAANPEASYSLNTAVVERDNNDSLKFEVPSREWFDLTDRSGRFGVSVLEDCRYGSDKPDDNTLRLNAHVYARSQRSALHLPGDAGLRHPRRQIRALRPRRRLGQRHAVAGQVPQPTSADLRNRTARRRPRPPDRVGRTLHRTDRHHGLQEDGGGPLLRRPRQRTLRQGVRRCDDRIPVGSRGGLRSRRTGTAHRQSDRPERKTDLRHRQVRHPVVRRAIRRHVRPGETCAGTTSARIRRRYSERRCGPQRRTHGTLGADYAGRDASRYDHERRDRFRDPRP